MVLTRGRTNNTPQASKQSGTQSPRTRPRRTTPRKYADYNIDDKEDEIVDGEEEQEDDDNDGICSGKEERDVKEVDSSSDEEFTSEEEEESEDGINNEEEVLDDEDEVEVTSVSTSFSMIDNLQLLHNYPRNFPHYHLHIVVLYCSSTN